MSVAIQPPSPQPSPTRGEGVRTSAACPLAHRGGEGSEPIAMSARRRISFWRYNLWLELSALALTAVVLVLAVSFTLAEVNRKYLELRVADATRVGLFLENHLNAARDALATFAKLPEAERSPGVMQLVDTFSDIYRLDQDLHVAHVYKGVPGSQVFAGFAFSAGRLADYLRARAADAGLSEIMRGYEDNRSSVYYAVRADTGYLLGRLDLSYLQDFLAQYSRFTGAPVLLVTTNGFVMLSGDPRLQIPAFNLGDWTGDPSAHRTLAVDGRRWIPLVSEPLAIGARVVTLIPTDLIETQEQALLIFALLVGASILVLVILKNLRLRKLLIQPLVAFVEKMRALEKGRPDPALSDAGADLDDDHFEELADIRTRFRAMAQAIRQREQSLARMSDQAQAASIAKSAFLANMSHEIRTPMTGIIGLSQLVLRRPLDGQLRGDVEKIERSARSLLGILNDILDFSKIEAGKLAIQREPFPLRQTIDDVIHLIEISAREKGLALAVEIDPGLAERYRGDPLRLKQVLTNLLGNAVKFTHQGQVRLRVRPGAGSGDAGRLRFEVRDTGIGISAEQQRALFDPFAQADGSTTRQYGGTGLGLAVSKQLVELMGGQIEVESSPSQGSCFRFEIAAEPVAGSVVEPGGEPVLLAAGAKAEPVVVASTSGSEPGPETGFTTGLGSGPAPGSAIDSEAGRRASSEAGTATNLEAGSADGSPTGLAAGPAAGIEAGSETAPESGPVKRIAASLAGRRILLVEDNAINQQIVCGLLEDTGLLIEVADNGQRAVELFQSRMASQLDSPSGDQPGKPILLERRPPELTLAGRMPPEPSLPELILMDIQMPVMDGYEAARLIRALDAKVPIIALTANAFPEDIEKAHAAGMNAHLSKPIDLQRLKALLGEFLQPAQSL